MERTRTGYRVLRWIFFRMAALCAAADFGLRPAPAGGGCAPLQLPLPAPRPREEKDLPMTLHHLLLGSDWNPDADPSVLLARVVRVDRYPAEVYARYEESRRYNPDLDLDLLVGVRGGRFQTIETLSGHPAPLWLEVDNTADVNPRKPFITNHMRLGEYWIIVYDNKTRTVQQRYSSGTIWLTGPDDPLLSIYRRHVGWLVRQDRKGVFAEMRTAILDPDQPTVSRLGALLSMRALIGRGWPDGGLKSPDLLLLQQAIAALSAQPKVPRDLQIMAMRFICVDISKEIAPGSDEAILLHYLIDIVKQETVREAVDLAADKLEGIATESSSVSGEYRVYYMPEIASILEQREAEDLSRDPKGFSPVSRAIRNLRRSLELSEGHPLVICPLPARQK